MVASMPAGAAQIPDEVLQATPVRAPMAAWLVGPSSVHRGVSDEPQCMMINEFDNGFQIGIHKQKHRVIGISIDTRQQAFQPGQQMDGGLIIDGQRLPTQLRASDETTLMMDVSAIPNLRIRLQDTRHFAFDLGGRILRVSSAGIADGFNRMGVCLGELQVMDMPVAKDVRGTQAPLMQEVTSQGRDEPLALALASIVPSGYRFDLLDGIDPMTPISWVEGDNWRNTLDTALTPLGYIAAVNDRMITIGAKSGRDVRLEKYEDIIPVPTNTVWTALQGARLRDVLAQWGQQAGVLVDIDLEGELMLPEDIAFNGDFNSAVRELMDMMATIDPNLRTEQAPTSPTATAVARPTPTPTQGWKALEGASLQVVLDRWATQNNVRLVWNANQIFSLTRTVDMTGDFTDALIRVLRQFDTNTAHPLATFNTDPKTGERILIVTAATGDRSGDNS